MAAASPGIRKIVVDTDLFVDHLTTAEPPSVLRLALQKFFCYTTVFQAIELFSLARTAGEQQAMEDAMASVKVLGLNARNAPAYGALVAAHRRRSLTALLAGGLCLESKLPLLTGRPSMYRGLGILLVSGDLVRRHETGEEILKIAGRARRSGR